MKKIFPLFFLILVASVQTSYSQWTREWALGYVFSSPTGKMKRNISQANGMALGYQFESPTKKLVLGADLNFSIYGYDQTRQQYTFPDGTTADMNIDVTNSFTNLMFASQYNLTTGKMLTPYVGLKTGYSWFSTNLAILDPDDTDSCKPVEEAILLRDGTWIYSVGAGVRYDLASIFDRMKKDRLLLNLSAYYTQGGSVNYMNTDVPDGNHSNHTTPPPNRSSDLEAAFINTQTQVVHKHHVGYVYTSFSQMMDYRLTLILRKSH